MNNIELLMPAGNIEKMRYAFFYGADACYLGMVDYSLRTMRKGELILKLLWMKPGVLTKKFT